MHSHHGNHSCTCFHFAFSRNLIVVASLEFKTMYIHHRVSSLKENFLTQDEKSYLHSHWQPVPKCKCPECNTFSIHVQMFQAMSIKRYRLANVSIFHYTSYDFVFQSWPHKNDFQTENICVLSG